MIVLDAIPPIVAHVRALPGTYMMTTEVADALDVSANTLRRLATRTAELGPSHETYYGRIRVALYDRTTVNRLHAHLADHRSPRGRPRLWDDEQRAERRRTQSRASYRRRWSGTVGTARPVA